MSEKSSSIAANICYLKFISSKHWKDLELSILNYSHGSDRETEIKLLTPFHILEKDLDSISHKYYEFIGSDKKTPIVVEDGEWRAIGLAHQIHLNHLKQTIENMRLHDVPNELIIKVENEINTFYKDVNEFLTFLKENSK